MKINADISFNRPLYDALRPQSFDEFVDQNQFVSDGGFLGFPLKGNHLPSIILWGPPGTGKTSFARILAKDYGYDLIELSGVNSGVADIRSSLEEAKIKSDDGLRTVIFLDEIHRYSKAQQDVLLPHIESGLITLIGATTENPGFNINKALRSRVQILVFKPLSFESLFAILCRAEKVMNLDSKILNAGVKNLLIRMADGDGRKLLIILESILQKHGSSKDPITSEDIMKSTISLKKFDRFGDEFYMQVSALHKSIRGSDPDASIYWFSRMVDGGIDLSYLGRRLLRISCEDVGLADPRALRIALDAWEAYERVGSPEGELFLAEAVVYLAVAPKSNSVYQAYKKGRNLAKKEPSYEVPVHLRNAVTNFDKAQSYGKDYHFSHDHEEGFSEGQEYFPEALASDSPVFYEPSNRGLEIKIKEKLFVLKDKRKNTQNKKEQGYD